MYPNLMGQMKYRHMSCAEAGAVIGRSRGGFEAKLAAGRFSEDERDALARYFNKPAAFLFALDGELPTYKEAVNG
jgi:hypothetical protein